MAGYIIDPQGPAVYFKDDFRSAASSCCVPDGGKPECLLGKHCRKPEVRMPSCQPKTSSKADNTVQCQECVYACRSKRHLQTHVFYAHRRRRAKKAVAPVLPSDFVMVTCEPVVAVVALEPDSVSVPSVAVSETVDNVAGAKPVSLMDKTVEKSTEA